LALSSFGVPAQAKRSLPMTSDAKNAFTFNEELQTEFARLSGDWNPMHMNTASARRTQAGRRVVHGVHIVVCALDYVASLSGSLSLPTSLGTRFVKPVYVGESVQFRETFRTNSDLRLEALVEGIVVAEADITLGGTHRISRSARPEYGLSDEPVCHELTLEEIAGRAGRVHLVATEDEIAHHFPNAVNWLGAEVVGGLISLSRLVGMECPGLHSLFSSFTVEFPAAGTPPSLEYRVVSLDKRFRLVKIEVNGCGLRGTVAAFARHPPAVQTSYKELLAIVSPNEFQGQRALVIGGSRGLGEFTAKALAAGGGVPTITYATGKEDADRVADEIRQSGGSCDVMKYDIHTQASQQLEVVSSFVPYLYYYATCQIFCRRTKRFDPSLLEEFLKFYVTGFYDLCAALRSKRENGFFSAFYPSSIAVADRPRDMTEYAMAKAAGEVLCTDLHRFWPGIHIISVRLPRLLTDQTATMFPTETASTVDLILPIIRDVQSVRV